MKFTISRHKHEWSDILTYRSMHLPFNLRLKYKCVLCKDCSKRKIV